jgi:His-Xaa-Ser system protein HxsD
MPTTSTSQEATAITTFDFEKSTAHLTVDTKVYSREAVLGAAYVFTNRCFVLLDAPSQNQLRVELKGRETLDQTALELIAGEFGNELLNQTLRQVICRQQQPLIEAIVSRTIGTALGPSSQAPAEIDLSELEALELDDEPFDDPLGIAVSWEDKYGKNKKDKKATEAKAAAEADPEGPKS